MTDQQTVRFHDGTTVPYSVPANSLDPRYKACTAHRVACDCREAERSEGIAEYRAQLRQVATAARKALAGHDAFGDEGRPCMCTGCQIVRDGDLSLTVTPFIGPMDPPVVAKPTKERAA
jgi:hypothetical protein